MGQDKDAGCRGLPGQARPESVSQLCLTYPPSTMGLRLERKEQEREMVNEEWEARSFSTKNTPHNLGLGSHLRSEATNCQPQGTSTP